MKVKCPLCDYFVDLEYFDNHYKRCSAIQYIRKKSKELYGKDIGNSNELYNLSDFDFEKKYFLLLNKVYENAVEKGNEKEIKMLENILYGANNELKDII